VVPLSVAAVCHGFVEHLDGQVHLFAELGGVTALWFVVGALAGEAVAEGVHDLLHVALEIHRPPDEILSEAAKVFGEHVAWAAKRSEGAEMAELLNDVQRRWDEMRCSLQRMEAFVNEAALESEY
jgi:hypothetical protein